MAAERTLKHVLDDVASLVRLGEVVRVLSKHGLGFIADRLGLPAFLNRSSGTASVSAGAETDVEDSGAQQPTSDLENLAKKLTACLEDLGPAFVKIGQQLAMREDFVPEAFRRQFAQLHERVTPIAFSEISAILREDMSDSMATGFESLSEKPLASGSIGQIHVGRTASGRDVVVKVRRPGIDTTLASDFKLIIAILRQAEGRLFSRSLRVSETAEYLAKQVLSELDFVREGAVMTKMRSSFGPDERVVIPEVIWDLTSSRVLTMEKLQPVCGWNVAAMRAKGLEPELFYQNALAALIKMVFDIGTYHGDVHPGNFMILADNRLGMIDWGNVERLSLSERRCLARLFWALSNEDFDAVARVLVKLSHGSGPVDLRALETDLALGLGPYLGYEVPANASGRVMWEVARVAVKHSLALRQPVVALIKNMASLEVMARAVTPSFDLLDACGAHIKEIQESLYGLDRVKADAMSLSHQVLDLALGSPDLIPRILERLAAPPPSDKRAPDHQANLFDAARTLSAVLMCGMTLLAASIIWSSAMARATGPTRTDIAIAVGLALGGVALGVYLGRRKTRI